MDISEYQDSIAIGIAYHLKNYHRTVINMQILLQNAIKNNIREQIKRLMKTYPQGTYLLAYLFESNK